LVVLAFALDAGIIVFVLWNQVQKANKNTVAIIGSLVQMRRIKFIELIQ